MPRSFGFLILKNGPVLSLFLLDNAALLDASLLTGETTQVIQLSATHLTMLVDNDAVNKRRLERENTLNADVVTDLANGETLLLTLASDLNHHTTVLLDTLLVTLLDATLIKSILISFNSLIITSQYTQATLFLARDYEKRGKGSTIF